MKKYRKKPVVIEAVQLQENNVKEVLAFLKNVKIKMIFSHVEEESKKFKYMIITTLEGDMKANFRDYIIKGVNGEFYPCKPDIFEKTYEEIEEEENRNELL